LVIIANLSEFRKKILKEPNLPKYEIGSK